MKLSGKTAVVTGGGRGIGRAIALCLASEGASVVVSARTESDIKAVAGEIRALDQQSLAVVADATQLSDLEQLARRTHSQFGAIDIWINNAGGSGREQDYIPGTMGPTILQPIWEQSEAAWDRVFETNCKSAFLGTKVVIPYMIEQGHGDVINIASQMGRTPTAIGARGYGEAKHAVIALTQNAALQAGVYGIRINAVSPGLVDTPGQRTMMETFMAVEDFPKMDSAESVARGVLYVLCDAPKTMTGQSLDLY